MLLPPEAFLHVPALAGKVLEPGEVLLSPLPRLAGRARPVARENGYPANWRLSDAEREATRAGVLARAGAGPVGVRLRLADVGPGHPRRRDQDGGALRGSIAASASRARSGRGSADKPALMAALDGGGGVPRPGLAHPGRPCRPRDRDPLAARDAGRQLCAHLRGRRDAPGRHRGGGDVRHQPPVQPLRAARYGGDGTTDRHRPRRARHLPGVPGEPRRAAGAAGPRRSRHRELRQRVRALQASDASASGRTP